MILELLLAKVNFFQLSKIVLQGGMAKSLLFIIKNQVFSINFINYFIRIKKSIKVNLKSKIKPGGFPKTLFRNHFIKATGSSKYNENFRALSR